MAILPPAYSRKASPSPASTDSSRSNSRSRSVSISNPRPKKSRFGLSSLRSSGPKLSQRLYTLIKCENHVISSYSTAAHERTSIATQLSEWGEQSTDPAINELSDKLGVLLRELGTQEEVFAQNLEEYRGVLKQIRNTEAGVQPSRDHKAKIEEEIARLRYKDPTSARLVTAEQELVRAEAECLVAEAQLVNVTRAKVKEAFALQMAAVVERAQKQIVLAKAGMGLLNLLDDTPVAPGDAPPEFEHEREAARILHDAEDGLRRWSLDVNSVQTNSHEVYAVTQAKAAATKAPALARMKSESALGMSSSAGLGKPPPVPRLEDHPALAGMQSMHPALRKGSVGSWKAPYPTSEVGYEGKTCMV